MEIRDVVHGAIQIEDHELPLIDSPYFQRLRQIRQMGFAETSFPGATHSRYSHSLGAMQTASQIFDSIFARKAHNKSDLTSLSSKDFFRFRAITRIAALLHDIGHGPLSHTTEFAMPGVQTLNVPGQTKNLRRKATHEDYTLKIILDSGLTKFLDHAGTKFGFAPTHVAALIESDRAAGDDFFTAQVEGKKIDFRPILSQMISSEMDADRMDYLRRDSFYAGVTYGQFDFDWLASNLSGYVDETAEACYLSLHHKALYTFEDFLISRFHMFLMVYYHHKTVILDETLAHYLRADDCDYRIPSDIEAYLQSTDAQLYAHLALSKNPWAKRVSEQNPYRLLVELHSGIPADKEASQEVLLSEIESELRSKEIHYIRNRSEGELSKYFGKKTNPIFVEYDNLYTEPQFIPLEKCTDLFSKYEKKRSIQRIYVSGDQLRNIRPHRVRR